MPIEATNNNDNTDGASQESQHHEREDPSRQRQPYRDPTGLRILCLHDAHSSASGLKDALIKLGERLYLKHGIDLVYINSPLCCSTASDSDRYWYEIDKTKRSTQQTTAETTGEAPQEQLIGLDASLCLLQQIWASMPFWGILGVGQGSAIGSLLSLLPEIKPRAKFGIFIQGEALIQEAETLVDAYDWSCLHIFDPDALTGTEEKLVQQFGGDVHRISRKSNEAYSREMVNLLGKYIIEQKMKVRQSEGECTALALQNQLYLAEQEASILIAQRIAENPPSILMAVVAPKAVAACPGGMKRRGKDEEGGGAPCPPEFLLRRDTRFSGDDEAHKASRAHPEDTNDDEQT